MTADGSDIQSSATPDTSTPTTTPSTDCTNDIPTSDQHTAVADTVQVDSGSRPLRLKKNIGLIAGISYVVGGIIGVGIFVSPQSVLLNTGQSPGIALCVWAFCAVLAFCGALCYAELGTRIRKSGGSYTYVRAAFGDGMGFLFLWVQLFVVRPMATALGALTAAEYTLRPLFLDCPQMIPRPAKVMVALCILGFLVFLNSYDTSWGSAIQVLSTACKLAALAIIIVVGIVFLCQQGSGHNLQNLFSHQGLSVGSLTLAVYTCNYAYMGWDHISTATEEVKNRQRNVPLSILLGVAVCAIVYILAIVSYHAVMTTPQILSGVAVAVVFTEMTVSPMMWVVASCIAMSATGIVNVIIFTAVRINFIGGRDGLFPEVLSMVSVSRKTPLVSCLLLGVATSIVILMGDITSVLGAYSLFRASGETVAILGMFRLRRKFPASAGTYVVPSAVPVFFLIIHISLAVMAITRDTNRYVLPLLLSLSGIPCYFLSKSRMFRRGPLRKVNEFMVALSQKLLLCDYASKIY